MPSEVINKNIVYWCADHKNVQTMEVEFEGFGIKITMGLCTHTLIKRIAFENIELTSLSNILDSMYDILVKLSPKGCEKI